MFLEERLNTNINFQSTHGKGFNVQISRQLVNRYAVLRSPFPLDRFSRNFRNRELAQQLSLTMDLFNRVGGMAGGFRLKNKADFTTHNYIEAPEASDGRCIVVSEAARTYQIVEWFKLPADAYQNETPRRLIKKPVSGTVLVGIEDANGNNSQGPAGWSVDNTTGIITLPVNKNYAITNITQAAQAVVTIGAHTLTTDDSAVFSGVVGMTEINTLRGDIVAVDATTITVDIDTTGFTAYSSGGEVDNNPQDDEYLTAGCEFDIPVAFMTDLSGISLDFNDIYSVTVELEEVRNPEDL